MTFRRRRRQPMVRPLVHSASYVTAGSRAEIALASNGLSFMKTNTSSTSNVRHQQKMRRVPNAGASFSDIRLIYTNFTVTNGGTTNPAFEKSITAEIKYLGVYYPVTFSGSAVGAVPIGGQLVSDSVAGLILPANATFYERVREVGPSGSQAYIYGHNARSYLGEGQIAGTDTGVTYIGAVTKEGDGARFTPVIDGGQQMTGTTLVAAGTGYTSAPSFSGVDPDVVPPRVVSLGFGNRTGTTVTSLTFNDALGHANRQGWGVNSFLAVTGGGSMASNTAIYCASVITGVPSVPVVSMARIGDSIDAGFTSADSTGDLAGNYGIFERAIANRYGSVSLSLAGNTAAGHLLSAAHTKMLTALAGIRITHALIALGSNDIASNGFTAANVAASNVTIAAIWRALGARVSFATLLPRFPLNTPCGTLVAQTPDETGFAIGGHADTFNGWLAAQSNGLTRDWALIGGRAAYADAVETNKWRVDQGSALSTDAIHPNGGATAIGIPFGATQLTASFVL